MTRLAPPHAAEGAKALGVRAALLRALPLVPLLALFTALFLPVLDPNVQLFFRDTGRLYYPVRRYIAERVARGELPLWNPATEAGTSLLGQVTPGLFHPLTLLYAALPFEVAFKLNHLLALPVAAAGMYLLARRLASPWAASCAAIAFAGSGYLLSMAASNLPYALGTASLPLSIWGLLRLVERVSAGRLLTGAALLAVPALAGEPQSMLLAGVIGTVWAVGAAAWEPAPTGAARARRAARAGLLAALWGAAALLLSGPASAPAAARLVQTSRMKGVASTDVERFATHPVRLLGLVIPVAFDDTGDLPLLGKRDAINRFQEFFFNDDGAAWSASILVGAPALLLAFAGAARRRGRFLLLGALVFLLAAIGKAAGVQDALLAWMPGFRYFRYAEKLLGPATLLLAAAAAVGADVALGGSRRAARWLVASSGALGTLLLAAGALVRARREPLTAWLAERGHSHVPALSRSFVDALDVGLSLAGGLALALLLIALLRASAKQRAVLPLASLACVASSLLGAKSALPYAPLELLHGPFPLADELVRRAGPSEGRWRLYTRVDSPVWLPPLGNPALAREVAASQALMPQYEVVARIEGVTPYFSALDELYSDAIVHFPSRLFRALNVRFAVFNPLDMSAALARKKGFKQVGPGFWLRDFGPSPRAFLADGARALPPDRARELLANPKVDLLRTAVLPLSDAPLAAKLLPEGTGDAGTVELARTPPERIAAQVDAKRDALLLLSTHWDGGWRARVDGQPAPVARVDFAILGVPVSPGRHQVELEFHPEGLRAGLAMLAAGLLLCGAWAALQRRRRPA
jgi:hypothetical protein